MPGRTTTETAAVSSTECAVLGLLTSGEQSGYDLLKAAERSVGFFWTPAKTQLYAVLPKLVERGLATVRRVPQRDRPDKNLYRITPAGETALRDGLEHVGGDVNRNALELRIFFGGHRPLEAVAADLERVRDHASAHLERLEEIERGFDHERHLFPWLTLLRGKEQAAADVRWAEQALALLER
jgi:DNA-binding PadR family transcriptional regulator